MKLKCRVNVHSSTPRDSVVKNPSPSAGDAGFIPGPGRSPGEGNGNSLHFSCLRNPLDRAWWATAHRVKKELDMTKQLNNNSNQYITPQINETLAKESNFSISPASSGKGCDYQSKHDNKGRESITCFSVLNEGSSQKDLEPVHHHPQ